MSHLYAQPDEAQTEIKEQKMSLVNSDRLQSRTRDESASDASDVLEQGASPKPATVSEWDLDPRDEQTYLRDQEEKKGFVANTTLKQMNFFSDQIEFVLSQASLTGTVWTMLMVFIHFGLGITAVILTPDHTHCETKLCEMSNPAAFAVALIAFIIDIVAMFATLMLVLNINERLSRTLEVVASFNEEHNPDGTADVDAPRLMYYKSDLPRGTRWFILLNASPHETVRLPAYFQILVKMGKLTDLFRKVCSSEFTLLLFCETLGYLLFLILYYPHVGLVTWGYASFVDCMRRRRLAKEQRATKRAGAKLLDPESYEYVH